MSNITKVKDIKLSKQVFYKQWLIILDICNKNILNETSLFYYNELKHLTEEEYLKAIQKTLREKKYPNIPLLGEILENVSSNTLNTLNTSHTYSEEDFKRLNINGLYVRCLESGYIKLVEDKRNFASVYILSNKKEQQALLGAK
jgi:hypothetical protein